MAALLLDLDGVLYEGENPVEGAAETVAWLVERAIPHLFLTNTTSRPRSALIDKLGEMGIKIDSAQMLTPPIAAVHWLKANIRGGIALFVPKATRKEFAGLPLVSEQAESGAAAVVVGDLGKQWDFNTLNRAFRLLISEPKPALVALGMTRYWRAFDGLRLDVAPFVVALEHASGTKPIVVGKPAAFFYQAALDLLETQASDTFMVGDDIRGDIEGAQRLGIRGLLVQTGKFQPRDLDLGIKPYAILDSIKRLPAWWTVNIGQKEAIRDFAPGPRKG